MAIRRMKALRRQAAWRKRRIIMDNDGDDCVYQCKEATPESLLSVRTTGILGTQIDTLVYSSWNDAFCICTHNSKVGEVFKTKVTCPSKPGEIRAPWQRDAYSNNMTADFIAQGTDCLRIIVDYCRQNGIEVFWSKRMNDMHESWTGSWYAAHVHPRFKKEHPECLMGTPEDKPLCGGWSAVDYGHKIVRDLAYRMIEEVCENYDIDGLMLDFMRNPVLFRATSMNRPVGRKEVGLMTDLVRRISRMADRVGMRRGRPIPIAIRVPDSVGYAMDVGLDIVRWMKEGLVDILVASCYFRLNPWELSVELGHKYGVPVYPCLSETRLAGQAKKVRDSDACWCARAANVWASGADGVYTFNVPQPRRRIYRRMGDPDTLAGRDKVYTTGVRDASMIRFMYANGERYLNRTLLSPGHPRELLPGRTVRIDLDVSEDLGAGTTHGRRLDVVLELRLGKRAETEPLSVRINGHRLRARQMRGLKFRYAVRPAWLCRGENLLEITAKGPADVSPMLQDLLLFVRY